MTAAVESATGLAPLGLPSRVALLLLGTSLDTPSALVVARVVGAALLSVGVACWLARNDQQSRAATELIAALLLHNVAAVSVLIYANMGMGLTGIGLWPAVALHVALAVWCFTCLRPNQMNQSTAGPNP